MAADVSTGTVATLNKNASLDVKASKKGVTINKNSNVIITDIEASNGVIHVIDAVLVPSSDERFTILVDAVVKADLVSALSAEGPYTVFAPTNDAFEALFAALGVSGIDDLTKDQLTPILLYHVVSGKVMAADVSTGMVPTLNDKASLDVKVSKKGVKIDKNANVIITDIEGSNGVVHVIDAVLIPSSDDSASASTSSCDK
jgi:transforming growth factor-beta-induced protein